MTVDWLNSHLSNFMTRHSLSILVLQIISDQIRILTQQLKWNTEVISRYEYTLWD